MSEDNPNGRDSLRQLQPAPERKRRHTRVGCFIVLVAVLAIGLFSFLRQRANRSKPVAQSPPVMVTTTTVTNGDTGVHVDALGTVTPVYTVTVTSQVSGQLINVNYTEGQMVNKGDLLAEIDPMPFQAQVTAAEGQLEHDKALLQGSRIDLARFEATYASNAIPRQQLEDQQAVVGQNEGTVKFDQGQLENAMVQLAYCRIVAPITGRIGLRLVDPGNIIQTTSSNSLAIITQLQPITVVFSVAEDYLQQILQHSGGTNSMVVEVRDAVENIRAAGFFNGTPCVVTIVFRQPQAKIIDTVDRVLEALPSLQASIPSAMKLQIAVDRTATIRASVREVERTLMISTVLVILVVFLFLRNARTTLIPSVAVPVSFIGTFGVMYLCGFSIDNLSLMALTISTGFVMDDAIVVIENVTRYLERGFTATEAAFRGAREIGFTVLTISISLVAVFIPLLMIGGIVGRLFREFAVTLSVAIIVSLVVSLTTTPMMCAKLLRLQREHEQGRFYRVTGKMFDRLLHAYERSLALALSGYHTGVNSYLTVLTAQNTLLSNRQTALSIRVQQMTASVQLINALGGGWDVSQPPSAGQVIKK